MTDPLLPLLLLLFPVYLLPSFLAFYRGHRNAVPILLLNLCLGWSLVGWVVAICWATLAGEGTTTAGPRYTSRYKKRSQDNPFEN